MIAEFVDTVLFRFETVNGFYRATQSARYLL